MAASSIEHLKALAQASKVQRLLHHPARYFEFLLKSKVLPKTGIRKSSPAVARTFWGEPLRVSLPSSSDIFLTGGKTHSSEIRLAQWMTENINRYAAFVDVGAHIGFFSLLASHFSGGTIAVQSFEPSRAAFPLLFENTKAHGNIVVQQAAVGSAEGTAVFHEFTHAHAEYSSLVLDNYPTDLKAFLERNKVDYEVAVRTLDALVPLSAGGRTLLKIDTEGNELAVLEGAQNLLKSDGCDFVIEFLGNENEAYRRAEALLRANGFAGALIAENGRLTAYADIVSHLKTHRLDSENVVFSKAGAAG